MKEIYVSTDIETDGPLIFTNSILSFASAAFTADGQEVGSFERNLDTLPGAVPDPDTMNWWSQPAQQEAWKAHRQNTVNPEVAFKDYVDWVKKLPGKPVFVGYPAGYDFSFMYFHMLKFAGESPFSFSALDIKSYAMATLKLPYRDSTKRNMPKKWFPKLPHTHVALDDAREQGLLFINMLQENLKAK